MGFLFLILYPAPPPPPRPPAPSSHPLCHTVSFRDNFVAHYLSHTQLCHTPSFTHTDNFVTHHFSHTTLSHTIFHTQPCHTLSFTHIFITHHLCHIFHTQLCHKLSFTHNFVTHTQFCHTSFLSHTHNGVAHHLSHTTLSHTVFHTSLSHMIFVTHNFVTHCLSHSTLSHTHTFVTHHLSHAALSHTPLSHTIFRTQVATQFCHTLALGVAGVALGDMEVAFAWQAWHFTRSTFVLGFRYIWHWAGSWRAWFALVAWGAALLCVAGVVYLATWTVHLRGRRGTWRHGSSICVAGVALGDIHLHFGMAGVALAHSNPRFACVGRPGRRGTLRGRCGIWRHGQSICVAGMALRHGRSICVAGVALGDIHLDFGMAGVALAHINPLFCVASVAIIAGSGGALGRPGRRGTLRGRRLATPTFVLRGRRGAYATGLGWLWWRGGVSGRRGTPSHARLRPVSRP